MDTDTPGRKPNAQPDAHSRTWQRRVVVRPAVDGRPESLSRVAFSPDSQRFAAGDSKGRLIVRDRSGAMVAETKVPSGHSATLVAWSPDGAYIATSCHKEVRLWRSNDLVEVAHENGISGQMAFCGGGKWLAILDWRKLRLQSVPSLKNIAIFEIDDGGYNNCEADCLAADPAGSMIAVFDRGGYEDDDTNHISSSATPKMRLIAAERMLVESERKFYSHNPYQLEFDPWRRRILILNDEKIGVWPLTGEPFRQFNPWTALRKRFGDGGKAIAVSKDYVVSIVKTGWPHQAIEFLDPLTFDRLASTNLPPRVQIEWIAASPDGVTLVTPERGADDAYYVGGAWHNKFGLQIWSVE